MSIAFTKLPGLDETALTAVIEPVLRAHHVDGVELVWRSDRKGWVLELTIERPGSTLPGAGVTVDLCSDISREVSAALDEADLIRPHYRLEVGSPGVERPLHHLEDFRRFAGQLAKLKLRAPLMEEGPLAGQKVLRGSLFGVDDEGRVQLETEQGTFAIGFDQIEGAHLAFDWDAAVGGSSRRSHRGKARGTRRSK